MKNWLLFGLCGLIWGSSFLLIKIGVSELSAFSLVSGRLTFASIAFAIVLVALRKPFPRDRKTLFYLALVGIMNTAIPFVLITSGEQTIDSGLASVLNATVPLFSIGIAHWALHDDKIHGGKLLGLITGFVGIVLLASRSVDPNHPNPLSGQLAVLVAAIFYAMSAVIIRKQLRHLDPVVTAGGSMFVGATSVVLITLLFERPLPDIAALSLQVKLAVIFLGIVNTFVANSIYFGLISSWGASRTTMVTYLVPPTGLLLGAIFNAEPLDWRLLVGAILIVGGVALANFWRPKAKALDLLEIPPAGEGAL